MNKQLISMTAVAAMAGAALAVESKNVVGYTAQNGLERNKFYALGVQFVDVSDYASREIPITNLVSWTNARAGSSALNTVDQIHVWNPATGWTIYFNKTGVGFVSDATATEATGDTVNAGDGVFFRRANFNQNANAKLSGAVYGGDSVQYTLERNKFYFISYPWPVNFPIANFVSSMTNPRAGSSALNTVDQVHVWDPAAGWTIYFNKTGVGFVSDATATEPTTDVIVPGQCVFFRRANFNQNAVLTFTKPAGL